MNDYVRTMREKIGHDPLILVGAGVFVYRDGRVLLQQRRDNGCWSDHGGCMEIGETPEQTARRELFEETGLVAGELRFLALYAGEDMRYTYPNGDQVYIVGTSWLCEDFSGEQLPETDETLRLAWFPLDALPGNISPPVVRPLRDFVALMRARRP